jgi:hypothetical protein
VGHLDEPGDGGLPLHALVEDILGLRLRQGVPVGYGIQGRIVTGVARVRGMDRFARIPGLVITTWLPTCPAMDQPCRWKAPTACLPEMPPKRPMAQTATSTWACPCACGNWLFAF